MKYGYARTSTDDRTVALRADAWKIAICRGLGGVVLFLGVSGGPTLFAQTAEISSQDAPVVFRSTSNLIPVPVVVRDSRGHAVGNLGVEDFQLFDNGKAQVISRFSVEKRDGGVEVVAAPGRPKDDGLAAGGAAPAVATPPVAPDRFVAYLFDDMHLNQGDLVHMRGATIRQIDSSQHAGERAAIYTTTGHQMQEFTSDREKLHAVLMGMNAGYATGTKGEQQSGCPVVTYYMADLIYNRNDNDALAIAARDALPCIGLADIPARDPRICETHFVSTVIFCKAVAAAKTAARLAVLMGDKDTESSLEVLRSVVTRMTSMPGQRTIVLVSPGFLVLDARRDEEMGLIDRAIKANVVIGALDARGLYTQITGGDASERVNNPNTIAAKVPLATMETIQQSDVMANLADGTGGNFYHGTNDYDEGFSRVAAAPEYEYVLGFSPLDLKMDGKLHELKVTLRNGKGLDVQFRKGYYAANYATGPAEQAKQRIEEAFFSRDEIHDLPAVVQTQYFKLDNGNATISAVTKIDVRKLAFKKIADRNRNDITVVTGLFDSDGNYISGAQKVLEMRLLDQTLASDKRLASGISVEHSFTVHPGRYTVRVVVRDTEGQLMSAQSSLVEVP